MERDLSEELTAILDFVEGRIQAKQFESLLYRDMEQFEHFLSAETRSPTTTQGLFLYLISQDYDSPPSILLSLRPTYLQEILPNRRDYTREELEHWLRRRLLELFRYVHKPPIWMQDPEWPIGPN